MCIAKNFIWTTLKGIYFLHPQIPDFQIVVSQQNILTNHTSMESLSIQLSDDAYISISKKWSLITGFVVQGHI